MVVKNVILINMYILVHCPGCLADTILSTDYTDC